MKAALKEAAEALSIVVPDLEAGKSFEAVVLFKLALALDAGFHEVTARDHRGEETQTFRLRGAPGHVASPDEPSDGASYFDLRAAAHGQSIELHNSLEFAGASGTEHEIDVAVVWKESIDALREEGGGVVPAPPLVGLELKEFGASKSLDKNLIRAFVACVVDLMPLRHLSCIQVGREFPRKEVEIGHGAHMFYYLTTARITDPSSRMCNFFGVEPCAEINTSNLDEVIGDLKFKLFVRLSITA